MNEIAEAAEKIAQMAELFIPGDRIWLKGDDFQGLLELMNREDPIRLKRWGHD